MCSTETVKQTFPEAFVSKMTPQHTDSEAENQLSLTCPSQHSAQRPLNTNACVRASLCPVKKGKVS